MFTSFAVPLLYGAVGFFAALFMRRAVSAIIIALLASLAFKLLGNLNTGIDWNGIGHLGTLFSDLVVTLSRIASSVINTASNISLALFLGGSLCGLLISARRA